MELPKDLIRDRNSRPEFFYPPLIVVFPFTDDSSSNPFDRRPYEKLVPAAQDASIATTKLVNTNTCATYDASMQLLLSGLYQGDQYVFLHEQDIPTFRDRIENRASVLRYIIPVKDHGRIEDTTVNLGQLREYIQNKHEQIYLAGGYIDDYPDIKIALDRTPIGDAHRVFARGDTLFDMDAVFVEGCVYKYS